MIPVSNTIEEHMAVLIPVDTGYDLPMVIGKRVSNRRNEGSNSCYSRWMVQVSGLAKLHGQCVSYAVTVDTCVLKGKKVLKSRIIAMNQWYLID